MNLKKLAEKLTQLAAKFPEDTIVYFGHRDGSGCRDSECEFIIGEGLIEENGVYPVNARLFCIGCRFNETGEYDDTPVDFDAGEDKSTPFVSWDDHDRPCGKSNN